MDAQTEKGKFITNLKTYHNLLDWTWKRKIQSEAYTNLDSDMENIHQLGLGHGTNREPYTNSDWQRFYTNINTQLSEIERPEKKVPPA